MTEWEHVAENTYRFRVRLRVGWGYLYRYDTMGWVTLPSGQAEYTAIHSAIELVAQ